MAADPKTTPHPEGPVKSAMVISVSTEIKDMTPATDIDTGYEEHQLLAKQIKEGKYDPNGPADVADTCQTYTC